LIDSLHFSNEVINVNSLPFQLRKKRFLNLFNNLIRIDLVYEYGFWRLLVKLTLPKFLQNNVSNLYLSNCKETKTILNFVETEIKNNDINFDLFNSKIRRIDLTNNAFTKFSFKSYESVLNSIMPKRMIRSVNPKIKYLWGNRSRKRNTKEYYFYDKLELLKEKGFNTKELPNNIIRFEIRLKTPNFIKSQLGFNTIGELLKNENWNALINYYKGIVESEIFNFPKGKDNMKNYQNENEYLATLKDSKIKTYLFHKWIYENELLEFFVEKKKEEGKQRNVKLATEYNNIYNLKKRVKEINALRLKLIKNESGISYKELANELKKKLTSITSITNNI
jgi:hypothetical protein